MRQTPTPGAKQDQVRSRARRDPGARTHEKRSAEPSPMIALHVVLFMLPLIVVASFY
jgi:hypothetical protein